MNTEVISIILAVSLASERLIELLKTLIPWLATQKSKTDENTEELISEKFRRIIIQLISLFCGFITAYFLAQNDNQSEYDFTYIYGTGEDDKINIIVLGILSSAGSVFWTQILGYTKALKDVKKQEAQIDRIDAEQIKRETVLSANLQKAVLTLQSIPPVPLNTILQNN